MRSEHGEAFNHDSCVEEEFFWRLDSQIQVAEGLGFDVETRRFSDFTFGLKLRKPQS